MSSKLFPSTGIIVLALGTHAVAAQAEAPVIQSPSPLIHLADNLDEKDKLGWCIDTAGRGFAEQLHSHSCKPTGGDTQFSFDPENSQIRSVAFDGKCMTLSNLSNVEQNFGLLDCVENEPTQQFSYDAETMEIRLASDASQCVAVGAEGIAAGPYMSRDLNIADCATVKDSFKQWTILN